MFFSLARSIYNHNSVVEHLDEEGKYLLGVVDTPGHHGVGPYTSMVISTHLNPIYEPHECTLCGLPCYGLAIDITFNGFLSDVCIYG